MRNHLMRLMIYMLLLLSSALCAPFKTGEELMPQWTAYKSKLLSNDMSHYIAYLRGAVDAIGLHDKDLRASMGTISIDDICKIVGNYLESHPDEHKQNGALIVQRALRHALMEKNK